MEYLENQRDLHNRIETFIRAYYEIGDLIPQTDENLMSGHFFPYSQSYYELENSYQLCLEGFYRYSFIALRSVLELGTLGIHVTLRDREHLDVKPWLKSIERTPNLRHMLSKLEGIPNYREFDKRFGLRKRILEIYGELCAFVHVQGYPFSSSALTRSNVNNFNSIALAKYGDTASKVISNLVVIYLLKYPVGMQPLPLDEKFGLNGPVGGFLQEYQVKLITSLLPSEETEFLQKQSDEDPNTQSIVEQIGSLPDLTPEQMQRQVEDFEGERREQSQRK
jgi:hypothetical protein